MHRRSFFEFLAPYRIDPAGQADPAVERHMAEGGPGHLPRLPQEPLPGACQPATAVLQHTLTMLGTTASVCLSDPHVSKASTSSCRSRRCLAVLQRASVHSLISFPASDPQVTIGSEDLKANHMIEQIFSFPAEMDKYRSITKLLEKEMDGSRLLVRHLFDKDQRLDSSCPEETTPKSAQSSGLQNRTTMESIRLNRALHPNASAGLSAR